MKRAIYGLFFVSSILLSQVALAYSLRCDAPQDQCEIRTTRMTIGDRVGIFSAENRLVALGVVTEIRGEARMIEIRRKYGTILGSHSARRILDAQANDPAAHFRIQNPLTKKLWGASASLISMGVGDGFVGFSVEGQYFHLWQGANYLVAKLNYLNANGEASDNLAGQTTQDVELSSYGLTGGLLRVFNPYGLLALHTGLDGGFAHVSTAASGTGNPDQLLNKRVVAGTVLLFRANIALALQREGFQPRIGVTLTRLHQSNSVGLTVGVARAL